MYFKACNAISGITKWPAKHYYSLRHSEKSRNLDTVDTLLRLEFLTTRAVTIRKIHTKKETPDAPVTSFFQFQGRQKAKQKSRMSMEMSLKIIHICDFTWNWRGKGECLPVQNWLSDTILFLRYVFGAKIQIFDFWKMWLGSIIML